MGTGFGVAAFTAVLALALPAQADFKTSQFDFVADCNDDGAVNVPSGNQLEVFNFAEVQGVITRDCTVFLGAEDSELNLGEGTNLLFYDGVDYKNFSIVGSGEGSFEIEVQVKKNSTIVAHDFTVIINNAEEAEAQFEENFCLTLSGNFTLSMNTASDEGGDVQFKKVATDKVGCTAPNIDVDGDIILAISGEDGEIQIEEDNHIRAGDNITVTATGVKSQVQSKKNVTLEAGGDITLSAPGDFSEVQAEENNIFTAGGNILLEVGDDGKLEVKKFSVFSAGGTSSILTGAGTDCKLEEPATLDGAVCP